MEVLIPPFLKTIPVGVELQIKPPLTKFECVREIGVQVLQESHGPCLLLQAQQLPF